MATAGSEWDFPGVWNGQRARVTESPRQTTGNNRWSPWRATETHRDRGDVNRWLPVGLDVRHGTKSGKSGVYSSR